MTAQAVDPPRREPVDPATCKHPSTHQFWWHAYDGTLCGACCDCGAVLAGGVTVGDDQAEPDGAE